MRRSILSFIVRIWLDRSEASLDVMLGLWSVSVGYASFSVGQYVRRSNDSARNATSAAERDLAGDVNLEIADQDPGWPGKKKVSCLTYVDDVLVLSQQGQVQQNGEGAGVGSQNDLEDRR